MTRRSWLNMARRFRRSLALPLVATMVLAVLVPSIALAVHDLAFQLDGDVSSSTTTSVGGNTQTIDWDALFDSTGTPKTLPAGFTASGFDRDFVTNTDGSFNTSDQTTFSTGSKDTLNPTPGWQCNFDNNVNSKIDIMNAYAAAYTAANGHQILYFALERNANTGDGNVAFWFLQDDVGCVSTGPSAAFTGNHQDGDLLVVSAFTNGGGVSTIDVYRWNGGAGGSLGTTSVAHGVDCKSTGPGDAVCATTNSGALPITGNITTPWPTSNKQDGPGTTLRISEFFEGGIDLTQANIAGKCFNVFIGDTRSSQSLTATLFDFAKGKLGECSASTTTSPSVSGSAQIPQSGTLSVTDTATTLTVTGASTWNGTYNFSLCFIGTDTTSTATCTTGGTLVDSKSVNQSTVVPFTSAPATVTSAGRYCWRGDFVSATTGVPNATDATGGECFNVTPRPTTILTHAVQSPVDFGQPIADTADLSNTANQPGTPVINPITAGAAADGTITFTLYGPDSCTNLVFTSSPVTVNGDGTYGPVSFTPTAPGTYHWKATYSGNLPNTLGSSDNAACDQTREDVLVNPVPTTTTTRQFVFPQDKAKIAASAGGNLAGSVSFALYDSLTNCQTNGSTGLLYSEAGTLHAISGASPQFATTNNTTFRITSSTATQVWWNVQYTSTNPAQLGSASACAENTMVTYTGDDTGITIP
jgi:hypothetical protein